MCYGIGIVVQLVVIASPLQLPVSNEPIEGAEAPIGRSVHFEVPFLYARDLEDGWEFQLFVDTDGDEGTGYGGGFERLVRGVEFTDSEHVSLRDTAGGGGPGGWGTAVGAVHVITTGEGTVILEIPVGGRTGMPVDAFRYTFETYFAGRIEDTVDGLQTSGIDAGPMVEVDPIGNVADDTEVAPLTDDVGLPDSEPNSVDPPIDPSVDPPVDRSVDSSDDHVIAPEDDAPQAPTARTRSSAPCGIGAGLFTAVIFAGLLRARIGRSWARFPAAGT
ncbi:MAG: hypothetical protein ACE5HE_09295 [Phycisphaerae bacterium]